mgnify:CR=1 FL=1|jgi:hypothetical protein
MALRIGLCVGKSSEARQITLAEKHIRHSLGSSIKALLEDQRIKISLVHDESQNHRCAD